MNSDDIIKKLTNELTQFGISSEIARRYLMMSYCCGMNDKPKKMSRNKPIVMLSMNGKYIDTFDSLNSASEITRIGLKNIYRVISGRANSTIGFRFMLLCDYEKLNLDNI